MLTALTWLPLSAPSFYQTYLLLDAEEGQGPQFVVGTLDGRLVRMWMEVPCFFLSPAILSSPVSCSFFRSQEDRAEVLSTVHSKAVSQLQCISFSDPAFSAHDEDVSGFPAVVSGSYDGSILVTNVQVSVLHFCIFFSFSFLRSRIV